MCNTIILEIGRNLQAAENMSRLIEPSVKVGDATLQHERAIAYIAGIET
jgi:hypothetical protein